MANVCKRKFHREGNTWVADDARAHQIIETKYTIKRKDGEYPIFINRARKTASYQVIQSSGNKTRYTLPKHIALEIIAELDAEQTPKPDSVN